MAKQTWTVPGIIERVIDGDTLDVTLDLGWGLYKRDHVRLSGINAPEVKTPEGREARDQLAAMIGVRCPCVVVSQKLDKYGRALADVIVGSPGLGVSDWMVGKGLAVPWDGTGKRPVPEVK